MMTIGLIGGVASGKSAVAKLLTDHGAVILDADRTGHEVLHEPDVIQELVARWGRGILNDAGEINRSAVAKIVFAAGNEVERQFLNRLTHPRINERLKTALDELRRAKVPAAVLDAALLLEAGWAHLCDEIIFVDVPEEQRLARARTRGWDVHELTRREATQLPLAEKRQRASVCLLNDGSLPSLAAKVAKLAGDWKIVKS